MKRIRTLLIMVFIICLSIGPFYIYSNAAAAKEFPQFYIKKEAGDDKEIRSLTLSGNLALGGVYEPVTISASGSRYYSQLSFMDRFKSIFPSNDGLDDYRHKYRSFMRGKQNPASFYEDSRFLVFSGLEYKLTNLGMQNCTFTIAQLNKVSHAESSFQVKVPQDKNYNFITISNVQKHDEQLDVITNNGVSGNQSDTPKTEIHRYRFDLKYQKLLSDKIIFSAPNSENNMQNNIHDLNSTNVAATEGYYLFIKESRSMLQDGGNGEKPEDVNQEIYAYHFTTDTVQKISLPQEMIGKNPDTPMIYIFHGPMIYSEETDSKGVKVLGYNFEKGKMDKQYTFSIDELDDKTTTNMEIKNNRIYLLLTNHDLLGNTDILTNYFLVADLESGKLLYKGKIIPKATGQNSSSFINNGSLNLQLP
ncbi:hypothetical protein HPT25_12450 [Bacillus sp. BRMEA1]|uniref:hypothetical protein n=1 Tax=Neobacillus endophyticus TaxID=2738405 RepID=UPI0015646B53|nr:hypothetical protein [Neobacillus endophyticus]NRD78197.1 hypothetical protein [Neobacillus endophyticus]